MEISVYYDSSDLSQVWCKSDTDPLGKDLTLLGTFIAEAATPEETSEFIALGKFSEPHQLPFIGECGYANSEDGDFCVRRIA